MAHPAGADLPICNQCIVVTAKKFVSKVTSQKLSNSLLMELPNSVELFTDYKSAQTKVKSISYCKIIFPVSVVF